MKKYFILAAVLLRCGYEFPTGYETIENDKVRPVVMIFDNHQLAEGSPMDTVDLRAYFGGEKIRSAGWSFVSGSGDGGSDTVSLEKIMVQGSYKVFQGENADSITMRIIIPHSFIREKLSGAENVKELVPAFMQGSFPPDLLQKNPGEVLDVLELLSYQPSIGSLIADSLMRVLSGKDDAGAEEILPALLQIFTATLNIDIVINDKYRAKSGLTVRYNGRLRYLGSYIYTNRNPEIDYVRLYKVRGKRDAFDPVSDASSIAAFYDLKGFDSIPYEKGFSYFLGVSRKYGLTDTGASLQGVRDAEHFTCEWFLQDHDIRSQNPGDRIKVVKGITLSSIVKVTMPLDHVNRNFTIWCVVYDYFLGERLRPVGFAVRCAAGVLVAPSYN